MILLFWPCDLKWPSCYILFLQDLSCLLNGVTWLVQLFWLRQLLAVTAKVIYLPACVAGAEQWQLACDSCCPGCCVSGRLAVITAWPTPGLAHYTTLVVSSHTCDWRLARPLMHPRDAPVCYRRASLQITHVDEGFPASGQAQLRL